MKYILIIIMAIFVLCSCRRNYTPKPRGYFRIDLPKKKYQQFKEDCPFTFNYPLYGKIEKVNDSERYPCWFDMVFPGYKAKIHLTYVPLQNDLARHSEEIRSLVYKHIIKADDIMESRISDPSRGVYGIIYYITGNTASSTSFLLTDSTHHFLSGSLYFSSKPNQDSLAPVINFFREDVVNLTETLTWK